LPSQFPFPCIRAIREIGGGKFPNNFEANRPKKSPLLPEGVLPRQETENERDKPMKTQPGASDSCLSRAGRHFNLATKSNTRRESDFMKTLTNRWCATAALLFTVTVAAWPLAVHAAPEIVAWGDDYWDQTAVPTGLSNVVAVAAGQRYSLALTTNGQVVAFGTFYSRSFGGSIIRYPVFVPAGLSNVIAIAGGDTHSLALKSDGRVAAWGYPNSYGVTNVPSNLSNVVKIAAGSYHNLILNSDGHVTAWGNNSSGQTNVPSGLSNVVAIAAGYSHSLALTTGGEVVAWGGNGLGQTDVPSGLSNVVEIAAGYYHNLARTSDGRIVSWGDNYSGQTNVPGGLTNVAKIAAGGDHSLALTGDGRAVVWGDSYYAITAKRTCRVV
jgi:alpha-tubulin suppressor-like RCC1 family protein